MKPKLIRIPHDQSNKTARGVLIKINDSLFVLVCDKKDEVIDSLNEGDVVYFGKSERTILNISYRRDGRIHCVCFASLRNRRDFTVYFRGDLKTKMKRIIRRALPGWPDDEALDNFGPAIEKLHRRDRHLHQHGAIGNFSQYLIR